MWRRILVGKDLLIKGLAKTLGSSTSINIWSDLQAGDKSQFLTPPISSALINVDFDGFTVNLLIDETTKQWSLDKLRQFVVPQQWANVLATPLSFSHTEDVTC